MYGLCQSPNEIYMAVQKGILQVSIISKLKGNGLCQNPSPSPLPSSTFYLDTINMLSSKTPCPKAQMHRERITLLARPVSIVEESKSNATEPSRSVQE